MFFVHINFDRVDDLRDYSAKSRGFSAGRKQMTSPDAIKTAPMDRQHLMMSKIGVRIALCGEEETEPGWKA
jgi:hypothetical protein